MNGSIILILYLKIDTIYNIINYTLYSMNCIICLDSGEEKLVENTLCKCVYKKHKSCWNNYKKSSTPTICPLCRINLSLSIQGSPVSIPSGPIPSAPQSSPTPIRYQTESNTEYVQISYEEFQDIIHSNQVSEQQSQQIQADTLSKRRAKAIVFGCVLVAIMVVILKLVI
jgi:hypothetical protein